MRAPRRAVFLGCIPGIGVLVVFLCSVSISFADVVTLKNGKEIKGLVVEQHTDRIIFSTADGEIPILQKGIKGIVYDAPEQNFLQAGKEYEASNRLGEALAYYQKALELNPDFTQARDAAVSVRNRFWAKATEGPRGEVEKKQLIYDSWQKGESVDDEVIQKKGDEDTRSLKEGLGVTLGKKGDWLVAETVISKKPAALAGLKKGDRLISIDGRSLRYLTPDVVTKDLLYPRSSNFTLGLERNLFLHKQDLHKLKDLGFKLKLEYQGIIIDSVTEKSSAENDGFKAQDLVIQADGLLTRYLPLNKVTQIIEDGSSDRSVLTIRRNALLARP